MSLEGFIHLEISSVEQSGCSHTGLQYISVPVEMTVRALLMIRMYYQREMDVMVVRPPPRVKPVAIEAGIFRLTNEKYL